jgi:hypothetical protein
MTSSPNTGDSFGKCDSWKGVVDPEVRLFYFFGDNVLKFLGA